MTQGIDIAGQAMMKVIESGTVAALLVAVIAGLCWFIRDLRVQIKDLTDKYLASMKEHSEQFAEVCRENAKAMAELKEYIRATKS